MAFPNLSAKPRTCPSTQVDNTVRSPVEAGYVLTRPRFTRQLYKFGPMEIVCDATDKGLFEAFYQTVWTSTIFDWTHPISGTVYKVRFDAPPTITPLEGRKANRYYTIDFTLAQV